MPAISFKHPNISKLILTFFFSKSNVPDFFLPRCPGTTSQTISKSICHRLMEESQGIGGMGWAKKMWKLPILFGRKHCRFLHPLNLKKNIERHYLLPLLSFTPPWKIHILNLKITPSFFRFQPLIFQGVFCFCKVRCRQQFRGPLAPVV